MILERIEVRHLRGIRRARFDNLSERLCLFHGPNESGKSTLVEALHFGLFERTAGQAEHKRALRSWGGTGTPEIELTFTDDEGVQWEVFKRFLDRPETIVHIGPNVRVRGEEAESRLRALLGTSKGSRYGVRPEDLGIWPLLFIRQGDAGTPAHAALTAEARAKLATSLSEATGALLLGSHGQQLLTSLRREHARWWTGTRRPTGALRTAHEHADEAKRRGDEAWERLDAWHADCRAQSEAEADANTLATRTAAQRGRAESSQARARRAATDAADAERAAEVLGLRRRELDRVQTAHRRQQALVEQRETTSSQRVHATRELERTTSELTTLETERLRAREALAAAVREADQARQALIGQAAAAERDTVQHQIEVLTQRVAAVEEADQQLRGLRDAIAETAITEADARRLESLTDEVRTLRETRDARAATLHLVAETEVTIDGQPHPAGTTLTLPIDRLRSVVLPGQLELHLSPPDHGDDAAARLREAEASLERERVALGLSELDEVATRVQRRLELERQRAEIAERVRSLAPQGSSDLRAALRREQARLARQTGPIARTDAQTARAQLDEAEAQQARQRGALAALDTRRDALLAARAKLTAELAGLHATDRTLAAESVELPAPGELTEQLATAAAAMAQAERHLVQVKPELELPRAQLEARDALNAYEGLRARRDAARSRAESLRSRLEHSEADLFGEAERARLHASQAAKELVVAQTRAAAAERARTAVETAWQAHLQGVLAPLRDAVADGIHLLFPGSELALDDQGDVIGLRTGDVVETFESLSDGAREQLNVLVRLGLARVLARGRRLPVILDDALVNADDRRRGRMIELLRRASDQLQVLVFTCHDAAFDHLAAPWQAEVAGRPPRSG